MCIEHCMLLKALDLMSPSKRKIQQIKVVQLNNLIIFVISIMLISMLHLQVLRILDDVAKVLETYSNAPGMI